MRAAVERNNNDGSVDVLVAFRVKVSNDQTQNRETGYRLRVKMAPADGQYRIAKLDQVSEVTVVVDGDSTRLRPRRSIQESAQNSLGAVAHSRRPRSLLMSCRRIAVVATMVLVSFTVPPRGVWWWVCISVGGLAILLMLVNRLVLPAITGWSLGRAVCGIAVVRRDGEAPGPWRLLLRDLAHLLDTASVSWDGYGRCGIHDAGPSPTCCWAPRCDASNRTSGRATCGGGPRWRC